MNITDGTRPVRAGEELDLHRLAAYLTAQLGTTGPVTVEQFPSGHSNLTYLVRVAGQQFVLRRPPFGSKVKTAHDMGREHRILSRLHAVYPPAPRAILYCEDPDVLGAPFYLMQRIEGVILRKELPAGLAIDAATARRLSEAMVDNLARIHAVDYVTVGLGDLGKPDGYVERQVTGWTRRYGESKTEDIAEIDRIAGWLAARIPKESGATLIHNDYKYDNVVLDAEDLTRIVGVLDWEMSTIGDPLMDLGTFLNYWVTGEDPEELHALGFGPTSVAGSLDRRQLVARYAERTGRDVTNMVFYYCFALFKTAVVLQQIYFRFAKGLTNDARFAALSDGVRVFARAAVRAADKGTI